MKKVLRLSSLVVMLFALVALCSCAPGSADKAAQKMEKAGYKAVPVTYSEVGENGEVASVTGTKNELSLSAVTGVYSATLYKTAKQAKEAYNKTKNAEGESACALVGKWVFVGGEEALKAFK